MKPPAVHINLCLAMLQNELAGYKGYPHTPQGEARFARALQEVAVSVEHLEAVLQKFTEGFPTVQNITDVALNLRPQFVHEESPVAKWKREFGGRPPEHFNIYPPDTMAMHWQAFRDALYYTEGPGAGPKIDSFWLAAVQEDFKKHLDSVTFIRDQVVRHGWPKLREWKASPEPWPYTPPEWQRRARRSTAMPHITDVPKPITQADIDRAIEGRPEPRELPPPELPEEGWADPDR